MVLEETRTEARRKTACARCEFPHFAVVMFRHLQAIYCSVASHNFKCMNQICQLSARVVLWARNETGKRKSTQFTLYLSCTTMVSHQKSAV